MGAAPPTTNGPERGLRKHHTPHGTTAPKGARRVAVATAQKRHGHPRMAMRRCGSFGNGGPDNPLMDGGWMR